MGFGGGGRDRIVSNIALNAKRMTRHCQPNYQRFDQHLPPLAGSTLPPRHSATKWHGLRSAPDLFRKPPATASRRKRRLTFGFGVVEATLGIVGKGRHSRSPKIQLSQCARCTTASIRSYLNRHRLAFRGAGDTDYTIKSMGLFLG